VITTLLLLPLLAPPVCGEWTEGFRSTKEVRTDARARVRKTCRALGASKEACKVLDAMVVRESRGDPCAVHRIGEGEYGLGVLGLSCKWHRKKWDGECEDFLIPEVSTVVAIRLYRRAVARHGAMTWREVQAVFATGKNTIRPAYDNTWCHRLKQRGLDCEADPRGQLGTLLGLSPFAGQVEILERISE